jgi:hypothetical protein
MATDGQRCGLPDGVAVVVPSLITVFRDEFEDHLNERRCPLPRDLDLPRSRTTEWMPASSSTNAMP